MFKSYFRQAPNEPLLNNKQLPKDICEPMQVIKGITIEVDKHKT